MLASALNTKSPDPPVICTVFGISIASISVHAYCGGISKAGLSGKMRGS
jgi:hypothetical protein